MAGVQIVDDEPEMRRLRVTNLRRDRRVAVEANGANETKALLARDEYNSYRSRARPTLGFQLGKYAIAENSKT